MRDAERLLLMLAFSRLPTKQVIGLAFTHSSSHYLLRVGGYLWYRAVFRVFPKKLKKYFGLDGVLVGRMRVIGT